MVGMGGWEPGWEWCGVGGVGGGHVSPIRDVIRVGGGFRRDAMNQMLLLAQHSDRGYEAVNSLIDKLYLKKRTGEKINNASAFICNSLRRARETIDPWHDMKW